MQRKGSPHARMKLTPSTGTPGGPVSSQRSLGIKLMLPWLFMSRTRPGGAVSMAGASSACSPGITSVLKHVSGDHELPQGLVLVIHRFARFLKCLIHAGSGSTHMFLCICSVLIGFFQGVEGSGHE